MSDFDELQSGLAKKHKSETTDVENYRNRQQADRYEKDHKQQELPEWQKNKGLGDMEHLQEGVKTRDFVEENIRMKMVNTTFTERCDYYFQDANYMESKVLRYRSLARDDNGDVRKFAENHTNRSLDKRKDAATAAANHFEKAMKLERKLNQNNQKDMSQPEIYEARDAIMRERMEGMIKAARVKSTSKEDEEFRIAKARLSCLTILKEQAEHLRTKATERYFNKIEANLTKEIEKERKSLSKSTSNVNSKWMDSLDCNDKESLKRELRESGNQHATIEDVKISHMFQVMSAERLRPEYVQAQELANKNKTFNKNIDNRRDSLLAPTYLIRRDKNGKPINKEELKKEQWNKKWLEACSDPAKSFEKKRMIKESFERFKRIELPDPKELKEKGASWFLKKDPVTFYNIYNSIRFDNFIADEPFAKELCEFDQELKEKIDACTHLSNVFSQELRLKHMINDGIRAENEFKILPQDLAEGLLDEKEEYEGSQSTSLSKYEKCYPRVKDAEKLSAEKKENHPAPRTAEPYDVVLEKAERAKNKTFNEESYEIYRRANPANLVLQCPEYRIAFEAVSEKLKEDKQYGGGIAKPDLTRMCGAMLRHVRFNNKWEPVSKEDMEAHEWNMKYLTNLRIFHLGPDLSVDDLIAKEANPASYKEKEKKKKQEAMEILSEMIGEEYKKSFTKDYLLPSPQELRMGMLEPLKKGESMNCPTIESILKNQEMMDDYIRMASKCLSIKETARAIPVGMDVYESHPEYSAFVDVFGSFNSLFMSAYGTKKYGIAINENGASAERKFPADAATLERFITSYEEVYKKYTDTKEARKKKL